MYDFPIMQIGEIGHYVENIMLPIGGKAWMDAGKLKFGMGESIIDDQKNENILDSL